jgi:hypothetical protein
MKCYNCGSDKHAMKDCKEPCGICGSNNHHAYDCIQNPNLLNMFLLLNRNGGKFKGKGYMVRDF